MSRAKRRTLRYSDAKMPTYRYKKHYKIKKKKSILKNRFFWPVVLALILIGAVIYTLIFASFFQITEIEIAGNQKVQKDALMYLIDKEVVKNFLIFQTKSIFLLNKNKAIADIVENFPQIAKAELKKNYPDILILEIREREIFSIWCGSQNFCFEIDREGVIFDLASFCLAESCGVKIKDLNFQNEPKLGEKVMSENQILQIEEIISLLKEKKKIIIEEFNLVSLEKISAKTQDNWEIYFNPKNNIQNQLENLLLTLEKEIPQEKVSKLEYIDLKFGNRVYYKYKNPNY